MGSSGSVRFVGETEGTEAVDAFLRSLGATDEQIETAWSDCHIARLAGDLVFAEGATLSATDVADRTGAELEQVLSLWRTLGIVVPGPVTPMFSARDAELTEFLTRMNPLGEHGDELLRVVGSSLRVWPKQPCRSMSRRRSPRWTRPTSTCWRGP